MAAVLHKLGAIDEATVREFDDSCLTSLPMIEPKQIVVFRATWLDFQRMNRNRISNEQKQAG